MSAICTFFIDAQDRWGSLSDSYKEHMKQFRDLHLRFPDGRTKEFFEALDTSLPKGWRREHEAEERAREMSLRDSEYYYYACDKKAPREAAMIAIYRKDAQTYHVTNVVPQSVNELKQGQYNPIFPEFYEDVLPKVKTDVPVSFLLGSDNLRLEDLMPPEVFRSLRAFSSGANRSTRTSHPSDQRSWFAFIVGLHRSGKAESLDATVLRRWFEEVGKWPSESALELAIQYERAIALLDYAAQH